MDTLIVMQAVPDIAGFTHSGRLSQLARKIRYRNSHIQTKVFSSLDEASISTSEALCTGLGLPARAESPKCLHISPEKTQIYPASLAEIDRFLAAQKEILTAALIVDPLISRSYPQHYWREVLHNRGYISPPNQYEAVLIGFNRDRDDGIKAVCEILS